MLPDINSWNMKKYILIILYFYPIFAIGEGCNQWTFGKLKAQVSGDSVILKDDTATRNCGVRYKMEVTFLSNDTLIWLQRDTGSYYACECNFNFSVTIDSLKPGNYVAKIYSKDLGWDTCYIGSLSFTITEPGVFPSPKVRDHNQSPCFLVGVPKNHYQAEKIIRVYPNPANEFLNITTDMAGVKLFRISDLANSTIMEFVSDKNENRIDISKLPDAVYFITVKNKEKSVHSIFIRN
jgi:hypothetical protein